jgi:hypothetical protein
MFSDRKLLLDSIDLLDLAIDNIIARGVDFVLIPGDLTKDGEVINHEIAAQKLSRLKNAGIGVFVVPGNHDVNCPDAVKFIDDRTEPVPAASAENFAQIYSELGYNDAIYKDINSLSYVTEPKEGLWLLALDSTRCKENEPGKKAIVSGKFSQQTIDWMTTVLREAVDRDKAVIAVMHHGVMEHWKGQAKLHPDYIIQDYKNFSKFLASWNVRIAFTGHYHANDIVLGDFKDKLLKNKFIYDIETGSLVTAPCPIRFISIDNNEMVITTDSIVDSLYPGSDFADNAHAFVKRTVMLEAGNVLRGFNVSEKDIAIITDAVGDAFVAHYNGDEDPSKRPPLDKSKLGIWGRFVLSTQQYALDGLWQDLPPRDNNVTLDLGER